VFRRKGFRAATMEDIADEIQVSKGALYLYFRTKAELLAAILASARESALGQMGRVVQREGVAEGLARLVDDALEDDTWTAIWLELLLESTTNPSIAAALRADRRADRRSLQKAFRELQARGRMVKGADLETRVDIALTLMEGAANQILLGTSKGVARRRLVRGLTLVLGG
jgi:AcrR family transcriptional regulator